MRACVGRYIVSIWRKVTIRLRCHTNVHIMVILFIILVFHMHKWTYLSTSACVLQNVKFSAITFNSFFSRTHAHTKQHCTQRTQKWVYIRVYFFYWIFVANIYSHDIDIVGHQNHWNRLKEFYFDLLNDFKFGSINLVFSVFFFISFEKSYKNL